MNNLSQIKKEIEKAGNKLVGDVCGLFASEYDELPSRVIESIGEETILDILKEHDKSINTAIESVLDSLWMEKMKVVDVDFSDEKHLLSERIGYNQAVAELNTKLSLLEQQLK